VIAVVQNMHPSQSIHSCHQFKRLFIILALLRILALFSLLLLLLYEIKGRLLLRCGCSFVLLVFHGSHRLTEVHQCF